MATLDELLNPAKAPAGQTLADLVGPPAGGLRNQVEQTSTTARAGGFLKDTAIDVAKGVVSAGESAVGLGDIVTGNAVGTGLRSVGFDPAKTNEILSSGYSEPRQVANQNVSDAKGFVPTVKALWENPSVAVGGVAESAPLSLGAVGASKFAASKMLGTALSKAGLVAGTEEAAAFASKYFLDPKVIGAVTAAGAVAEGATTSGSIQEQGAQAGRPWESSVVPAIAAGVGTAAIGMVSSKIPGFHDAETALAIASEAGKKTTLLNAGKEIAKTMFKEGALEEMPQSAQEQIFTNLAIGRPWKEGVGEAAGQGLVVGALQGGGMEAGAQVISGRTDYKQQVSDKGAEQLINNAFPGAGIAVQGDVATIPTPDGQEDVKLEVQKLAEMLASGMALEEIAQAGAAPQQVDAATTELPNMDDPDNALAFFEQSVPKEDQAAMADVFANIRQNNLHKGMTFPQQLFNMVGGVYESRTGKKLDILGGVNEEAAAPAPKFARLEDGPDTLRYNIRGKDYAYAPGEGQTVDDLRAGVEGKSPAAAVNWLKKNSQLVKEVPNVQTDQAVPEPVVPQAEEVVAPVARGDEADAGGVPGEPVPATVQPEQVVSLAPKSQAKDIVESKTPEEVSSKIQAVFGATYAELDQLEAEHPGRGTNKTLDLADDFMADIERAAANRDYKEVEQLLRTMRKASSEWDNISKNAGKVTPIRGASARAGVYDDLSLGELIEKHSEVFGKAPVGKTSYAIRKALEDAPVSEAPKLSIGVKTKGQRPSRVKAEIEKKYGALDKVIASGKLNILRAADGLPEGVATGSEIYSADGKTVVGAYVGGKVYLVADAIAPGEAPGVFLHEVAHRLLDQDTAFKSAKTKIVTDFGKLDTQAAKDARGKVPANTPPASVGEEGLAYFLQTQEGRKSSLWRRLVVAVRSGLRRLGFDMQYTEGDILAMFTAGARSFVQTGGAEGTPVTSPAMLSMREAAKAIFSKLDQVSRASFQGMKAQGVANFLTKQGVKKAEMEAVGLNEWLAAKKPTDKVTQAELVDFIKANTVELEDVVLGSPNQVPELSETGRTINEDGDLTIEYATEDGRVFNVDKWAGEAEYQVVELKPGTGTVLANIALATGGETSTEAEAVASIQEFIAGRNDLIFQVGDTHFSQYTEPGAVEGSYREMFVTAPGGEEGHGIWSDTLDLGLAGKGGFIKWSDGHSQYSDVTNPIVRIRFNEVNADGKRILRIEEMQGPSKDNQAKMPKHLRENIYQLGVKRILAYAKENGFDGVALATKPGLSPGETQADRYSLEKQVDSILVWESVTPGLYHYEAKKDGRSVAGEQDRAGVSGTKLAETIGKGLAEKAIADLAGGNRAEYSGLALNVGGEGLKQLYDNQLPAMLEAYGKGRMESATLPKTKDLAWSHEPSRLDYEGPVPTRQELDDMYRLTQKGGPDIFDNPFTGRREDFAINVTTNSGQLREAIKAVDAGESIEQALSYHGGAKLFGATVTPVADATVMPYLSLTNAPASYPMFSLSEPNRVMTAANDALSESRKKVGDALLALARPRAKGRELYEKYAPQWLSVTSLHHIAQVFGKNVPQIKSMDRHVDDLVTTKTAIIDRAYSIHKAAEKAASDKDGSGVAKFNRAALTGTFNQMTPWSGMFEQDWVPAEGTKADRLKDAARAWSAAGMNKSTGLTFQEAYRESADAFNALSPMEQIQLQRMVEDTAAIRQRERTNLLKRIELLSEGIPELRKSLMLQFNASFNNLKGMYLPLSRFGDFILEYTNAKGQRVLEAFPDAAQRKAVRETLAGEGVDETTVVERVKDKNAAVIAGMPQELMSQLTRSVESKFLASVDPTDELAVAAAREHAQAAVSDMNQTFFRWLPDTSAMKNSVRRKNIQGASDNMLRGYLGYIQRHAVAIAWSEVGSKIEQDIQGLANENAELRKSGLSGEGPVNLDMRVNLLNDMRARVKAIRTTNVGGLWSGISKLNTGYFMTSPSAFFVQMTQIPTLTLPKLGAMFGWGKSSKALAVAGREAFSKKFSAEAMLADPIVNALYDDIRATVNETNRREGQALGDPMFSPAQTQVKMRKLSDYQLQLLTLREAMDRNLLDISAAHEAFELTRGGDLDSKMSRLFRVVMLPMQHGELASRKTAVLATLDLALKSGKGLFGKQNQDGTYAPGAIDDIHEVVKGTLFSYAKEDMGAATQGGAIRTILQFQKFRVFTGLRIARVFLESVKGIPSAERAAARKEFIGIMGMSTLIGGVKGTVYAAPIMAIANLLFGWDDDDKPYSAELDFTNWMEETFGKTAGDAIAHGPLTLMGTNISRRVGLGDIYGSQAEPPPGLHGAALASWWAGSLLGPTFSVAQGWFKGYDQMMNKGNYMRGLEDASPKPVKDALKAFRFATEGVKTGDGRKILSDDEIGVDELLTTFFGFQSDEVARAQAANAALGKMSTAISERRGRLINDTAKAILSGDGDIEGAIAAVTKHAQKMPRYAITASEIKGAIAKRIKGEFGVTGKRELGVAQDYEIDVLGGGE